MALVPHRERGQSSWQHEFDRHHLTADLIVVNVPGNLATGQQLTITRGDNGKESVVGLTVHVGGTAQLWSPPVAVSKL